MIKVQRVAKPKILLTNETKWVEAIKKAKQVHAANPNKENKKVLDSAIKKYNHTQIKQALLQMFNGKCSFCESYIENVDFGDIEHFKPKSKFPELAVAWENLLLSCKKCNGAGQKGDKWPSKKEGGPLIDPCVENPEDFFEFVFDEKTLMSIVKPKNVRGATSENIYGLNKHTLVKDRNRYVQMLVIIAKNYGKDHVATSIIDEATLNSGEYAAFAKMVKSQYAK